MKRFLTALLLAALLLPCCGCGSALPLEEPFSALPPASTAQQPGVTPVQEFEEIRAVWLSFYELTLPEGGLTRQAFTNQYAAMFDKAQAFGLNTLFVHVRPFSDAIYPSELYPWSDILTGRQGQDPGYDPLGILCELARQRNLRLHAWINPFRVTRHGKDLSSLAQGHPGRAHADDGWVVQADSQYFWNPSVPETHGLIYDGVRELLRRYPLAGIHIDDYFYPTTDEAFDRAQYEAYRAGGGALLLDDWRREAVSQFVAGLWRAVKRENLQAVLSVSPLADVKKNYDVQYADVARWLREPGYADWMIPQLYFGFENSALPFQETAREWDALPRHEGCKLVAGLAAYKTGQEDAYAGAGKTEWQTHDDILARELKTFRALESCGGFALYSFWGIFGDSLSNVAVAERNNLQKLLN